MGHDSDGGGNFIVVKTNKKRKINQNESDWTLNATDEGPMGAKLPQDSGRGVAVAWTEALQSHQSWQ